MKHENQIRVIQDRILDLRTALFYDVSESVLRLPPTVIHTIDADESGQLWFIMPRPKQQVSEFDTSFPAQLNYFKKNTTHSLQIIGRGYIVHDPEELCSWMMLHPELPSIGEESILVKVTILKVEVQEWIPATSILEKTIHTFLSWCNMVSSGKTTYEFQPSYYQSA
jgi:hypothetical protein